MKKTDYNAKQNEVLELAHIERQGLAIAVREQLAACDKASDEYGKLLLEEKSANNRLKEVERLQRHFSKEEIADLCYAHRIDFAPLVSHEKRVDTREFKLRFIRCLNAIAANDPEEMRGDEFSAFAALASGRIASSGVTLKAIQSAMNHKGTTQARYFRDFLAFFGAVEKGEDKSFAVKLDVPFVKRVVSLFG